MDAHSPLFERIQLDVITAMKAHQPQATATLRMLVSALKNQAITLQKDLTDEDVVSVLSREAKRRKESILAFETAGRQDLALNEKQELDILQPYLPEQMGEDQVKQEVMAVTSSMPGAPFGKVMGVVMAKLKGRADGTLVQRLVKEHLG